VEPNQVPLRTDESAGRAARESLRRRPRDRDVRLPHSLTGSDHRADRTVSTSNRWSGPTVEYQPGTAASEARWRLGSSETRRWSRTVNRSSRRWPGKTVATKAFVPGKRPVSIRVAGAPEPNGICHVNFTVSPTGHTRTGARQPKPGYCATLGVPLPSSTSRNDRASGPSVAPLELGQASLELVDAIAGEARSGLELLQSAGDVASPHSRLPNRVRAAAAAAGGVARQLRAVRTDESAAPS